MEPYIKKGGSLTQEEKVLKYGQEIQKLLEAVWAPKQVAVIHCQVHQKWETTPVQGN
jgi:hypothetical protein